MKRKVIFSLASAVALLLVSCEENPLYESNTNTRGETSIVVEQNLEPLIETSIVAFEGFRPKAHVKATYMREIDLIEKFAKGHAQLILLPKDFTPKERTEYNNAGIYFRTKKLGISAIALVSKVGEDSTYTEEEILKFMTSNDPNDPRILFDDVQSSNFNYFLERIAPQKFGSNVKALKSNLEVIEYVKDKENYIGVIGYNWISDYDDPEVKKRCENLQIIEVAKTGTTNYVPPYAYYIYEKEYPFTQFWYIHNRGGKSALGAGFSNYMINEKGQLIVKKSGLQPYYKITREFDFRFE